MIPAPFYELLPYIYVLVGALATFGIEAILGKICGVLMITAGVVIYKARSDYRNRKPLSTKAPRARARGDSHRPSEISRRNTGEPVSQRLPATGNSRRNTGDPVSQVRLPSPPEPDFTAPTTSRYMIPTPIYELLPFIYAVAGVLAVVGIEEIPGKICGALLLIASITIYQARWRYRHRKVRPEDVASQNEVSQRNTENSVRQPRIKLQQYFEQGAACEESGDYQQALEWYAKAADQDYAPAQVNLGALYAEGQGVQQNFQEAMKWYQKAADQGYAPAQFNLGIMCILDQGNLTKDYFMAYIWFSRAALQGDEDAGRAKEEVKRQLTANQLIQAEQILGGYKPGRSQGAVNRQSTDPSRTDISGIQTD